MAAAAAAPAAAAGFAAMANAGGDLAEIDKRKRMIEEMNRKKKQLLTETLAMRRMKTSKENATLRQIEVRWQPLALHLPALLLHHTERVPAA